MFRSCNNWATICSSVFCSIVRIIFTVILDACGCFISNCFYIWSMKIYPDVFFCYSSRKYFFRNVVLFFNGWGVYNVEKANKNSENIHTNKWSQYLKGKRIHSNTCTHTHTLCLDCNAASFAQRDSYNLSQFCDLCTISAFRLFFHFYINSRLCFSVILYAFSMCELEQQFSPSSK